MAKTTVTGSTPIAETLERLVGAIDVFDEFGMACYVCSGCATETLAVGARMHHVDLTKIVERLNTLEERNL